MILNLKIISMSALFHSNEGNQYLFNIYFTNIPNRIERSNEEIVKDHWHMNIERVYETSISFNSKFNHQTIGRGHCMLI